MAMEPDGGPDAGSTTETSLDAGAAPETSLDASAETGGDVQAEVPDESGAAASAEPAGEVGATPEVPPAAEAAAEPPFVDWNGQIDTLSSLPGWADLPDTARTAITQRLQTVMAGWQRAYTKKVEQIKQESMAALTDVQQKYDDWLRLVTGEDDPIGTRDATIQKLQAELDAARASSGSSWEQERAALTSQYEEKLAEATKFHESLRAQMDALTAQIVEAHNEYLANWLAEHAPDLAEADRADGMTSWVDLVLRGHEPDVALRMVRVKYPEPQPAAVPADVQMMSMSSAGKVFRGQSNVSVEQRIRETTPTVDWGV